MKRRQALAMLAAGACAPALGAARKSGVRGVAMVWELAQTLAALGTPPIAVAELNWYRTYAATPRLPVNTIDVGLRVEPNLELLQQIEPDFIAINSQQTLVRDKLARIAPVQWLPIHTPDGQPYRHATAAALRLAELVGTPAAGFALCDRVEATIAQERRRLRNVPRRPVYAVSFEDTAHLRVSGGNSIVQDVLDRLGFPNAWHRRAGLWGFEMIGIEDLAAEPDAHVICLNGSDNVPNDDFRKMLAANELWQALPSVRAGRVTLVAESLWLTGGSLPVAQRFAQIVGRSLA
jgi:iron complex transport system substrate-binding protein